MTNRVVSYTVYKNFDTMSFSATYPVTTGLESPWVELRVKAKSGRKFLAVTETRYLASFGTENETEFRSVSNDSIQTTATVKNRINLKSNVALILFCKQI